MDEVGLDAYTLAESNLYFKIFLRTDSERFRLFPRTVPRSEDLLHVPNLSVGRMPMRLRGQSTCRKTQEAAGSIPGAARCCSVKTSLHFVAQR